MQTRPTTPTTRATRTSANDRHPDPPKLRAAGRVHPRMAIRLLALAILMLGAAPAPSGLRDYAANGTRIRAGFVAEKPSLLLGEPVFFRFRVENLGPGEFEFDFGGDSRGKGRHDRYQILAIDSAGKELIDPRAQFGDFGGIGFRKVLKPGEAFEDRIDVAAFRVFDKPGAFTLTCSFAFDPPNTRIDVPKPIVQTTLPLTLLQPTPERVAKLIDELSAAALAAAPEELPDLLDVMASVGKQQAVPRLAELVAQGPGRLRAPALNALARIPGDASFQAFLDTLKSDDPSARVAAASAMGGSKDPRVAGALLAAYPKEALLARRAILESLGRVKSDRALPLLEEAISDRDRELATAAVEGLVANGGDAAIAVLARHAFSEDHYVRYKVVLALAEQLRQRAPVDALVPILLDHRRPEQWYDCIRLVRMYGGEKAIPLLLGCVDYSVGWSGYNWWLLEAVRACTGAPEFEYIYDPNREGTPEEIDRNLGVLARLRPLAAALPASVAPKGPAICAVPLLQSDPPIDFSVRIISSEGNAHRIVCGFFDMRIHRTGATFGYHPSDAWQPAYALAARLGYLVEHPELDPELGLTPDQARRLRALDVPAAEYRPPPEWHQLYGFWREAPAGAVQDRAEAELRNAVQTAIQTYHVSVETFIDQSRRTLSSDQFSRLPDAIRRHHQP